MLSVLEAGTLAWKELPEAEIVKSPRPCHRRYLPQCPGLNPLCSPMSLGLQRVLCAMMAVVRPSHPQSCTHNERQHAVVYVIVAVVERYNLFKLMETDE